jgi:FkbM family methyltransferase
MIRRILRHFRKPTLDDYRRQVKNWLMPLLPADPVIVEAGSHFGEDTVWLGRYWPRGQVHAFEPSPDLFALTTRHTRWIPNVHRYPFALSDRLEAVELHVSSGASTASSSIFAPKEHLVEHPSVRFDARISVPAITLALWAQQYQIPRVDFLWLDMQGAELRALQGMGQLLDTATALHLEVSTRESYAGAPLYPELAAWMRARGFIAKHERFEGSQGDIFFAR